MISLVVLRQYVKVFFGKHRLELHDVGGQQSGGGLCLFATSGSLPEVLRGRSHSSEVGWSELWEEARKEESVSGLPIRGMQLQRRFFKFFRLWLFLEQGRGSFST